MTDRNLFIPLETSATRVSCCTPDVALRFGADDAERLAALCKALGHPVRVQIVDLLSRYAGQACVCDIEGQFDLTQPTISHHLRILREAGILGVEQRGLWAYYYVLPGALEPVRALAAEWGRTALYAERGLERIQADSLP
jgi:ArsR family transcriptional regulator